MDFRGPTVAAQQNAVAIRYLTKSLDDPEAGQDIVEDLILNLGNAVTRHPEWHPIRKAPREHEGISVSDYSQPKTYQNCDHTVYFVRGLVTCPYSEKKADELVDAVIEVSGLHAYKLPTPLYSDDAFPVVVESYDVQLEADGTIRSRDALKWFLRHISEQAQNAEVGETWWNVRSDILGTPHGSRSSLMVNQHTGLQARKILETLNKSGVFGNVIEDSLEMLSKKRRSSIAESLIRSAVSSWNGKNEKFEFELRDEICRANVRDTWDDEFELSVSVNVGNNDLFVSGFFYPKTDRVDFLDPRGKRRTAEKFG